ncbi:MAG: AMP-binding protein, partial [Mycobacteriales bacterium]
MTAGSASLGDLLRRQAARLGDRTFLRFPGMDLTFAAVDALSDRFATVFEEQGVGAGDRVALMLRNQVSFPLSWFALAKLGAVAVPVNPRYRAADLAHVLHESRPKLVLAEDDLQAVLTESGQATRRGSVLSCGALREAARSAARLHSRPISPDQLLNLQYTSGTTGMPKACMLTHDYWLRLGQLAVQFAELRSDDVALTAQAFSYIDPQWNTVMALGAGIPLVVLPKFSPSSFWASARTFGATFCYLVGAMPVLLFRQQPNPEIDRAHRVRLVVCSGIDPALHAQYERRWGTRWREAYGSTETGVDLAVPVDADGSVGSGSLGFPVRGKQVR